MKKKLVISIALVTMLLLAGCVQGPVLDSSPGYIPSDATSSTTPDNTVPETNPPLDGSSNTSIKYIKDQGIPDLQEGFGLYGSQVEFDGVYPGWTGTVPLTIVNGQDRDRLFVVSVRNSAKVKEGYEVFPQEYFCWITIAEPEVNVIKGATYQIPVTLAMPLDADYKGKRAEVRILVEDTTQTGLVQIALETKWFIITAD